MLSLVHPDLRNDFTLLSLSRVEFHSALRRRQRAGDIDAGAADAVLDRFTTHLSNVFRQLPLTDALLESTIDLIDRYPLRALDAVQLAGCVALFGHASAAAEPVFVCSDRILLDAAAKEGLRILEPMDP